MKIKDYIKQYKKTFVEIKSKQTEYFNVLLNEDKVWLGNIENKTHLLKNKEIEEKVQIVINKLKSDLDFKEEDSLILSTFISKINSIVNILDRINNFKENTLLENNSRLKLYELFNSIKSVNNLSSLNVSLNSNLNNFLPHLFSIIKHCQNPNQYPIYYKYWKNILKQVLDKSNDYDSMCSFYREFPNENRHLIFGSYLGTIGFQIAKNIKSYFPVISKESPEYKFLVDKVINIPRFTNILDKELNIDVTTKINVKEKFVNWMIANDGYGSNYFSQQFGSDRARFQTEIDKYEEIYRKDFNNELFFIDSVNYKKQLDDIEKNIYSNSEGFSEFSKNNSNGRPKAILGKKNYIKFLNEYFVNTKNNITTNKSEKIMMLNQILYGPPGTGKTYSLNTFLKKNNQKEIEKKNEVINVNDSKVFWHLAPGQGGFLWNKLKNGDRLGYQWCDNDEGDLKKMKREETNNFSIKHYFSWVKKGDYFCIISGKKFYGIAEALEDYDFKKAITKDFAFQTIQVKWIKVFDTPELLNASYTPTFGQLNGGKRWESLIKALNDNNIFLNSQKKENIVNNKKTLNYIFSTFHQSFSYEDFIEGIKPDMENSDYLRYGIEDGVFKIACDKAANIAGFEDLDDALNSTKEEVNVKFKNAEPFYLLIDEINRGNVSGIFGELITLIEEDKRLGKKNETRLTLPYSKKEFSVPPNLHIIGTMNTADRSVEALDTALRRRFSFVEMMPETNLLTPSAMYCNLLWKYKDIDWDEEPFISEEKDLFNLLGVPESLIDKRKLIWDEMKKENNPDNLTYFDSFNVDFTGVNLELLLETINNRIEILLDRDHTIGHSYFMKVANIQDLKRTFKNSIIPLLQEYFYRDYEKIGMILGQGFVELANEKDVIFPDFIKNNNYRTNRYNLIPIDENFSVIDAISKLWK